MFVAEHVTSTRVPAFDPDALFSSLPRLPITSVADAALTKPPQWHAGPLRPYNGFTAQERIRHWQLAVILRRLGIFPDPPRCDLCGATERVRWHAEHYGDLSRSVALCWRDHMTLHRRFASPAAWKARVARHGCAEWIKLLPMVPFDFAGWIERHYGREARDPWTALRVGAEMRED